MERPEKRIFNVPVKVHHEMMTCSQTLQKLIRKIKKTLMNEMKMGEVNDNRPMFMG